MPVPALSPVRVDERRRRRRRSPHALGDASSPAAPPFCAFDSGDDADSGDDDVVQAQAPASAAGASSECGSDGRSPPRSVVKELKPPAALTPHRSVTAAMAALFFPNANSNPQHSPVAHAASNPSAAAPTDVSSTSPSTSLPIIPRLVSPLSPMRLYPATPIHTRASPRVSPKAATIQENFFTAAGAENDVTTYDSLNPPPSMPATAASEFNGHNLHRPLNQGRNPNKNYNKSDVVLSMRKKWMDKVRILDEFTASEREILLEQLQILLDSQTKLKESHEALEASFKSLKISHAAQASELGQRKTKHENIWQTLADDLVVSKNAELAVKSQLEDAKAATKSLIGEKEALLSEIEKMRKEETTRLNEIACLRTTEAQLRLELQEICKASAEDAGAKDAVLKMKESEASYLAEIAALKVLVDQAETKILDSVPAGGEQNSTKANDAETSQWDQEQTEETGKLRESLEAAVKENYKLKEMSVLQTSKIEELTQRLSVQSAEMSGLQTALDNYKDYDQLQCDEIAMLKEANASATEDIERLKAQILYSEERYNIQLETIRNLEETSTCDKCQKTSAQLIQSEACLTEALENIRILTEEAESESHKHRRELVKCQALCREYEESQRHLDARCKEYDDRRRVAEEQVRVLQGRLGTCEEEAFQLRRKEEDGREAITRATKLDTEIRELRQVVHSLKVREGVLLEENAGLAMRLAGLGGVL
ncbi:hypothetical protein HDU84_006424 [Entophlyctis sp. JEL0112]|nr:hypothetical protein HDU84_006424 [Entophlyctis sp. JEL0112]